MPTKLTRKWQEKWPCFDKNGSTFGKRYAWRPSTQNVKSCIGALQPVRSLVWHLATILEGRSLTKKKQKPEKKAKTPPSLDRPVNHPCTTRNFPAKSARGMHYPPQPPPPRVWGWAAQQHQLPKRVPCSLACPQHQLNDCILVTGQDTSNGEPAMWSLPHLNSKMCLPVV